MKAYDSVNLGRHTAKIVDVEISNNVRFGKYIADVFKPVYKVGTNTVKDNGIFVYKVQQGFQFEPKRNWGYSKYLKLMQLEKDRDNSTGMIAPLKRSDIIHNVVMIDVFDKTFTNDFSQYVKYNVARTVELITKGDFPF